ncbi:MAG: DNA repair protein RadC [Bacteroidaceae bacterium]|nr:DNA repair protein RadC [Bacteroidaceae bacterium]
MIRKDFQPFNEEPVQKVREEVEETSYTSIKHWAEEDRPREKLMAKGAEALTNAELLAILIGGGTTKKSAVELMQEVLRDCGDTLRGLNHMTLQDLLRYNGIGEAKALTIIAAAEIGKRRMMEDSRQIPQMRTGTDVLKFMSPIIQDLTHEESWALLLNNNARLIHLSHLSTGGLAETVVDVRMLLKEALLHDATCFILVHNHPSGNLRPSRYDEELTQRVARASATVNLRMIDHVIVTEGDYYSFSENGKL